VPPEEPVVEPAVESTASATPDEQVEPAAASLESNAESPEEALTAAEQIVDETIDSVNSDNLETTVTVESKGSETPPVSQDTKSEITSEDPLDTEQKPSEVNFDLSKLTLEDKGASA
jgi:hypothetical protein